jgi:hypothetical protein
MHAIAPKGETRGEPWSVKSSLMLHQIIFND